jgi:hypothetical protein
MGSVGCSELLLGNTLQSLSYFLTKWQSSNFSRDILNPELEQEIRQRTGKHHIDEVLPDVQFLDAKLIDTFSSCWLKPQLIVAEQSRLHNLFPIG